MTQESRIVRAIGWSLVIVLTIAVGEVVAYATTRILVRRGVMVSPPASSHADVTTYFQRRDSVLGWADTRDTAVHRPCVSTYGDSFTYGAQAEDSATYPSVLGSLLRCRVANYGVRGYGTDQAFMLSRAMGDSAPVVILGHTSENILRNVNQWRELLYPGQPLLFKPRFILRGNSLQVVELPIRNADDLRSVEERLHYDAFEGRPRRSFPYSVALARWLATDFQARAILTRSSRHGPFYAADHPSRALQTTVAILDAFSREVTAQGRQPFVLLIPVGSDFVRARKTGRWVDQPLYDSLQARGVKVIHAGPAMLNRIDGDPCRLFAECHRHFAPSGYRLLAEVVADAIQDKP